MPKLVLIDGNAILHRAYHALPPLTTKTGEPINAVYGMVSMLLRVIQDLKPTHITVCFDRKEPTFRHKEFAAYQAQRPAMDKELSGQFEKAKETIEALGIPIYEMAGFEADDIIGTIAERAVKWEVGSEKVDNEVGNEKSHISRQHLASHIPLHTSIREVVIVTGDRDILQLVTDKIKVYLPIKGLSDAKLFSPQDVVEKMGVKPEQITDYKALVGDPSDNYPGVSGVGPKSAIKLLSKYGNLENIYKNLNNIDEATRKKLVNGKENAYLSQKLARIVKDVEMELDLEKAGKWQIDSPQVLELFAEFGFKTLTQRVKDVGKQIVSENQMRLI